MCLSQDGLIESNVALQTSSGLQQVAAETLSACQSNESEPGGGCDPLLQENGSPGTTSKRSEQKAD